MRKYLLLIGMLLLCIGISYAQSDLVEIPLSGTYTVTVPEDWEVTQFTGSGYYWESDSSTIRIRTYSPSDQIAFEFPDLVSTLENLVVNTYEAREFDEDALEPITIGDNEGFSYTFEELSEGKSYQRVVIIVEADNSFFFMGNLIPLEGQAVNEDDLAAVQAALESITYTGVFMMYEGTQFEIPEDWTVITDYNTGFPFALLRQDSIELEIGLWPGYGGITGFEEPAGFLAYAFSNDFRDFSTLESFDRAQMEDTQVSGFDAVLYTYDATELTSRENYMRALIVFNLTNYGIITATIRTDTPDEPFDVVYDVLDTFTSGMQLVCALFADPGIRIRSEASTTSELVRQTEDEVVVAVGKTVDSAGFTWFDIREGWIRSDVIFYEQNACARIPDV